MGSFASLLAAVAVGAFPGDSLPAGLALQVRELIGARWNIAADDVELAWGRHADLSRLGATPAVRLSGAGRDGWFVVTLESPGAHPMAIAVRAGSLAPRLVAARPLSPGTRLADEDLVVATQVVWGDPAAQPAGLHPVTAGWEVRRPLRQGDPLMPPAVQAPRFVTSGDPVTFVWARGAVRLERVAIAQGSARLGERVHAQVGAGRLVGIVTGPGTARITEGGPP